MPSPIASAFPGAMSPACSGRGSETPAAAFPLPPRLDAARGLLRETDLPVGEIAYRVGFESGAAFARALRRVDGRPPSAFRQGEARPVKRNGPFGGAARPPRH